MTDQALNDQAALVPAPERGQVVLAVSSDGMGRGDAKLAGFIGLVVGLNGLPFALFVAFVAGGIVGGVLLAMAERATTIWRGVTRRSPWPMARLISSPGLHVLSGPGLVYWSGTRLPVVSPGRSTPVGWPKPNCFTPFCSNEPGCW